MIHCDANPMRLVLLIAGALLPLLLLDLSCLSGGARSHSEGTPVSLELGE